MTPWSGTETGIKSARPRISSSILSSGTCSTSVSSSVWMGTCFFDLLIIKDLIVEIKRTGLNIKIGYSVCQQNHACSFCNRLLAHS